MLYTKSLQIFCRKRITVNRITDNVNRLKSHIWHVKMYFKDHNIMQTVDPIEMNFEGLKMQN